MSLWFPPKGFMRRWQYGLLLAHYTVSCLNLTINKISGSHPRYKDNYCDVFFIIQISWAEMWCNNWMVRCVCQSANNRHEWWVRFSLYVVWSPPSVNRLDLSDWLSNSMWLKMKCNLSSTYCQLNQGDVSSRFISSAFLHYRRPENRLFVEMWTAFMKKLGEKRTVSSDIPWNGFSLLSLFLFLSLN